MRIPRKTSVAMRRQYRQNLSGRIADLDEARQALREKDSEVAEAIRDIAHMLKGSGGMYGFPEITEAAAALGNAALDQLLPSLDSLLDVLRRAESGSDDPGLEA